MIFLKRTIPLLIAFVVGIVMAVQYYIPHTASEEIATKSSKWVLIVAGFALVIGVASLLNMHISQIRKLSPGWGFSVVLVGSLIVMTVFGFIWEEEKGTPFKWLYDNMLVPMQGTVFSMLAFFIASAAYRAFRARSWQAAVLLIAAVIVMLGRVPIGHAIHWVIPKIADWIYANPNMAARRAIYLGVGLGMIATSIRIIFGIERAYLGGGE